MNEYWNSRRHQFFLKLSVNESFSSPQIYYLKVFRGNLFDLYILCTTESSLKKFLNTLKSSISVVAPVLYLAKCTVFIRIAQHDGETVKHISVQCIHHTLNFFSIYSMHMCATGVLHNLSILADLKWIYIFSHDKYSCWINLAAT